MSKDPFDHHARANEMCNQLWEYIDSLSERIKSMPEGVDKTYLMNYKATLGMIAELYVFSAMSMSKTASLEEVVYKVLFKEVFKDRTITLPYEPKEGETLHDIATRYKEREPTLTWIDKDLKHKASDTESV